MEIEIRALAWQAPGVGNSELLRRQVDLADLEAGAPQNLAAAVAELDLGEDAHALESFGQGMVLGILESQVDADHP